MRFLSLATYPSSSPRHGGQLRLSAIHSTLRQKGWKTREFAVCPAGAYPEALNEGGLLAISEQFSADLHQAGLRTDIGSSRYVLENKEALDAFDHTILSFNPDVIALEQPWLWLALQDHFARFGNRDRIAVIYSSQNVEERLVKEELSMSAKSGDKAGQLKAVEEIERSLARSADGIIAVSATDADYFRDFNDNVIVAANGVWLRREPGGLEFWREEFKGYHIALFVGSYHLPNGSGFCKCVLKESLAYLAPDEKIVIAGRVGELLKTLPDFRRHSGVNLARIYDAGAQDDGGLASLYEIADTVVLPITEGGGTNIKTAEALMSNKRVIATKMAMRGYDAYLNMSGLTVVQDEIDFPQALKASLAKRLPFKRSVAERRLLNSLLWSNTLRDLPAFFSRLSEKIQSSCSVTRKKKSGRQLSVLLGEGWHIPEERGVWSNQRAATLRIPLKQGVYSCTVNFSGFPPRNGRQIVTFLDGNKILNNTVIDDLTKSYEVEFSLTVNANAQSHEISLESSTLLSPEEAGYSADPRQLGIGLQGVLVAPAKRKS